MDSNRIVNREFIVKESYSILRRVFQRRDVQVAMGPLLRYQARLHRRGLPRLMQPLEWA